MKRSTLTLFLFAGLLLLTGCNSPGPEKYFDIAVLNCNLINGFGGSALDRELQSPSVKLVDGTTDKTVAMKRSEVMDTKIQFVESNLQKVKALKVNDDTKDILQASIALHEFVLPVYKNEYKQLAALYDNNALADQIETLNQTINSNYATRFEELYNAVIAAGKPYAAKHNINVNWGK